MINAIQTALSGLVASTKRVEASASNIANIGTAGSLDDAGNAPYAPISTVQQTQTDSQGNATGVTAENLPRENAFVPAYDPDSPFANSEGFVGVPNVNLAEEAVNLKLAEATYKANIAVLETVNELSDELLSIFDDEA